jgi:hypothetical protein
MGSMRRILPERSARAGDRERRPLDTLARAAPDRAIPYACADGTLRGSSGVAIEWIVIRSEGPFVGGTQMAPQGEWLGRIGSRKYLNSMVAQGRIELPTP